MQDKRFTILCEFLTMTEQRIETQNFIPHITSLSKFQVQSILHSAIINLNNSGKMKEEIEFDQIYAP